MKITVLGAGAWGTAMAMSLAQRHQVCLWARDPAAVAEMQVRRENTAYLPGYTFPPALAVTADFEAAVAHIQSADEPGLLILAAPVAGLRPLLLQLRPYSISNLVWLCKGFEENTRLLPHQVVAEVMGEQLACGVLSGPSFAQEVARGLPCGLTIATANSALNEQVVAAVHGGNIRVYSTDDVIGVEVGAAVKNILAIATGVCDGMGLGLNARAALITRGLAEITRLGVALGGRYETFMGLAGVGDLILTCTGDLSRNRSVGMSLAQGKTLEGIIAELGHVAEGVRCAKAVCELAAQYKVEMPITHAVVEVLFNGDSPQTMVKRLLARDAKGEVG